MNLIQPRKDDRTAQWAAERAAAFMQLARDRAAAQGGPLVGVQMLQDLSDFARLLISTGQYSAHTYIDVVELQARRAQND